MSTRGKLGAYVGFASVRTDIYSPYDFRVLRPMEGEVIAHRFELADVVYVKRISFRWRYLCANRDANPADVLALIETEHLPRPHTRWMTE